jgi:hypothetical protein
MGMTFAGYGLASWGWILTKGYNITLRQWFSPLNPWAWPASTSATIPRVPKGRIFPGSPPGGAGGSSSGKPPPNSIYNVPGIGPLLHFFRGAV